MTVETPRRRIAGAALLLALVAAGCAGNSSTPATDSATSTGTESIPASTAASLESAPASVAATKAAAATSSCTSPAAPTIAETEGPYYKAGAPESADLVTDGMAGTRLTLTGLVVSTDCTPIANARVEIWQADSTGTYDNTGYILRGYVTTGADGSFTIRTIVPGEYPGRTEHIHVKVTPPGGATLTTQVYFPGTSANDSDGIFDSSLLLDISEDGDGLVGTYKFVLAP